MKFKSFRKYFNTYSKIPFYYLACVRLTNKIVLIFVANFCGNQKQEQYNIKQLIAESAGKRLHRHLQ